jgi:hypothetical protein
MDMKRTVALLMAALLMPIAAGAEEWKSYAYPERGFSIQFPGVPMIETGTIKNATGIPLPMTRYVVRLDRITYTLSVADYSSINADALTTIVETQRSLAASGKVTGATGARIGRNFGRVLNLEGTEGSRSAIGIFFVDKHLYTVVGKALPPNANEESEDATRFLESLQFPDDSGGFLRFFGSSGSSGSSGGSAISGNGGARGSGARDGNGPASTSGGSRLKDAHNPAADATCAGKSAGDAVQLTTPGGPVPATCTLVARPNSAGPAQ